MVISTYKHDINGYIKITCHKWLSYKHDINGYPIYMT